MPHCWGGPWRSTGHVAIVKAGGLLGEWDFPEGGYYVEPPFEDGRLGGDNFRRLGVVSSDLLAVENGEISRVARFAGAREVIEGNVG